MNFYKITHFNILLQVIFFMYNISVGNYVSYICIFTYSQKRSIFRLLNFSMHFLKFVTLTLCRIWTSSIFECLCRQTSINKTLHLCMYFSVRSFRLVLRDFLKYAFPAFVWFFVSCFYVLKYFFLYMDYRLIVISCYVSLF